MPIDMSNVKEIMHGNKEVVKIEDSNGNVLWEKEESGWITGTYTKTFTATTSSVAITGFTDYEIKQTLATSLGVNYSNIEITSREISVNIQNAQTSGSNTYYRLGLGTARRYLRYINRGTVPLNTTSSITFDTTSVIDDDIRVFYGTSNSTTTSSSYLYMKFSGTQTITVSYRYNPNLSNLTFNLNLTTNSSDIFNYTTYTSGSYSYKRIHIPTDAQMLTYIYDNYGIDSSRIKIKEYKVVVGYSASGGSSTANYAPILTSSTISGSSVTPNLTYEYLHGSSLSGGSGTRYNTITIDKSNVSVSYLYGYYSISTASSYWFNMSSNTIVQILTSGTDARRTRIEVSIAYE